MQKMPLFYGIIPARYDSSRFPGKPLADIMGKPMFQRVYERALSCGQLNKVALATDDERIRDAAEERGVPVVMTRSDHASGTDRIDEAADILGIEADSVVVNIQGDEPALDPKMITEVVAPFLSDKTGEVMVSTLAHEIAHDRAQHPDQVKVVFTEQGRALYFSRAPIPHTRDGAAHYWGHVGMYAYRREALKRFTQLGPSALEDREKLEQLRLLENNIDIYVVPTESVSRGVDRPEDIDEVIRLLAAEKARHGCDSCP